MVSWGRTGVELGLSWAQFRNLKREKPTRFVVPTRRNWVVRVLNWAITGGDQPIGTTGHPSRRQHVSTTCHLCFGSALRRGLIRHDRSQFHRSYLYPLNAIGSPGAQDHGNLQQLVEYLR
jgi:hypothetical protein